MRVKGSVAVVTGASSGIGRATAAALARAGASVILAAREAEALQEAAAECESHGGTAMPVPVDVTDYAAVRKLADTAAGNFGSLDIWVNNAAVTAFGPFTETPIEDVRRVIDVNVMGYIHGARAALPYFRDSGRGVLVNVSSVVGVVPQPYTHAYSMSKAAVSAMSTSIRQELMLEDAKGVKVCTVLPGTIDTPIFHHGANYTGREVQAMPPVYSPQRVARAVVNVVRVPRRETVVGPLPRTTVVDHKASPGTVERIMAVQVERSHLSRTRAAATSGNLHDTSVDQREVTGGWHGKRRTAVRRLAAVAALGGAVVAASRLNRR